ncbi:MAG: DHA2 family efflux MFS transporter permease subunit, partial [Plesiomonas shigelloides]
RVLEGRETQKEYKPMDTIGLGLMVLGVGSLQIMLDQGRELGWFNSNEIVILAVLAVVSLAFFIVWELTDDNPVIDLSLFGYRNFSIAVICTSLGYMIYFGVIVLLPLLMQTNLGYTASWAGWASAPVGLIPLLLSPIIGRYAHKIDMRILVSISFLVYAGCFLWRATLFSPQISFEWIVWPQFVQGIAVACFFMPLTTITLSGLPPSQLANASSLSNFMRTLAGSIGTSITTTLWDNGEAVNQTYLTEHVNPYNPAAQQALDSMHQLGMNSQQAAGMLAQQITQQSYILSANTIFTICGVMFLGLLVLIWFAKPPFNAAGGNSGAH